MIQIEVLLLIASSLILISIGIAKFSDSLGVPALLLFIGVGAFAGSEGPGGIYFNDAPLAQAIGIISLVFILFSGGLETKWNSVKTVIKPATVLASLGVLFTAVIVAVFISLILKVSFLWGLLLGSIISSTDAAAVFSILKTRNISLKGKLKPLLELESGSNDPMAVFLTISSIQLLINPESNYLKLALTFFLQMGLGAGFGLGLGKLTVYLINKLNFSYEGLYPVFSIAMCVLIFSVTNVIGGSGFLAIYVAGLIIGNNSFVHKNSMIRFFDGLGTLGQIAMFLTLGLLVFPSHLIAVTGSGLLIAAFLIFIARPVSVFISLSFFNFKLNEKAFVSWVGLRGAVPIILATFPLLAGVINADAIFNIVFFIVLTSVLLQGWTLVPAAKFFKVDAPLERKKQYPLEFNPVEGVDTELIDFIIPYDSAITSKPIAELGFPNDSRIVLIWRNETSIVPSGGTILEEGDTILTLVNKSNIEEVKNILSQKA